MPFRPLLFHQLRRYSTHSSQSTANLIKDPRHKHQIWISRTHDPFFNLSIEHYLLQNTPHDSIILFLYINRPCVVIGRNQNPWLEANLNIVGRMPNSARDPKEGVVELVRRRSGGGTVYHDEQNVNYSVICPTAQFSRDKHAEMVTRAMRKFNPRVRVNERHDIVLDQGDSKGDSLGIAAEDMHRTAYYGGEKPALKVSGSAFKLTKQRSLHHGTCLLGSDLDRMRRCLRSDARPFLKARGVDSVRSPVGNLFSGSTEGNADRLVQEVTSQFRRLYTLNEPKGSSSAAIRIPNVDEVQLSHDCLQSWVGDELLPEVQNGVDEIKSLDWTYRQTPQFTLSSHPTDEDTRERPPLPEGWPSLAQVYLKIRSGVITSSRITISADPQTASEEQEHFQQQLDGKALHDIADFTALLEPPLGLQCQQETLMVAHWLNKMFGNSGESARKST